MNLIRPSRRNFLRVAAGASLGAVAAAAGRPQESMTPGILMLSERQVPVLAEADVVVCGGGTAGISAAYCAARRGAKVILLERWPSLGGMATHALVKIWHTSDRTEGVITGFTREAVERGGRFVRRLV